jgi:threonine aldolase
LLHDTTNHRGRCALGAQLVLQHPVLAEVAAHRRRALGGDGRHLGVLTPAHAAYLEPALPLERSDYKRQVGAARRVERFCADTEVKA